MMKRMPLTSQIISFVLIATVFFFDISKAEEKVQSKEESQEPQLEFFSSLAPMWPYISPLITPLMQHGMSRFLDHIFEETSSPPDLNINKPKTPSPVDTPVVSSIGTSSIAYRVYRLENDRITPVSLDNTFKNSRYINDPEGDKIVVKITTNIPGILAIRNIDVDNQIQPLGNGYVKGGWPMQIGPFEFYGTPGTDKFILDFRPCKASAEFAGSSTLQVAYGRQGAKIKADVLANLPQCREIDEKDVYLSPQYESMRIVSGRTGFFSSKEKTDVGTLTSLLAIIPLSHK